MKTVLKNTKAQEEDTMVLTDEDLRALHAARKSALEGKGLTEAEMRSLVQGQLDELARG